MDKRQILNFALIMDIIWNIMAALLILVGIIGCFLPVIPGPSLGYLGLLSLQLRENPPFETTFLLIWAGIILAVTAMDYVIQPLATKKFGGSNQGIWGSTIGLVLGIFFPPFGIILGPLIGALLGEIWGGKNLNQAIKPAMGSFIGFLAGTAIKLIVTFIMGYYFVVSL